MAINTAWLTHTTLMSGMWDTLNPIDFKLKQDRESFWNLMAELHAPCPYTST